MQEAIADGDVLLEELAATRARREAARDARRVMVWRWRTTIYYVTTLCTEGWSAGQSKIGFVLTVEIFYDTIDRNTFADRIDRNTFADRRIMHADRSNHQKCCLLDIVVEGPKQARCQLYEVSLMLHDACGIS